MKKVIEFNMKAFLNNQYRIYSKYVDNMHKDENYFYKIDAYLMQLLEECFEYKTALSSSEKKKELTDIIMYTGSMISMISEDYYEDLKYDFPTNVSIFPLEHDVISEIFDSIFTIRRKFDERKWHKTIKELSYKEEVERLEETLDDLFNILNIGLEQLNYLSENSIMDIDMRKIINTKQNKFLINEKEKRKDN